MASELSIRLKATNNSSNLDSGNKKFKIRCLATNMPDDDKSSNNQSFVDEKGAVFKVECKHKNNNEVRVRERKQLLESY